MKKVIFGTILIILAMTSSFVVANITTERSFAEIYPEKTLYIQDENDGSFAKDGLRSFSSDERKIISEALKHYSKKLEQVVSHKKNEKRLAVLSKTWNVINTSYNWTAGRVDAMFTRKGFIETMLIVVPLYVILTHYYPLDVAQKITDSFIGLLVTGTSKVTGAFLDSVVERKDEILPVLAEYGQLRGEIDGTIEFKQKLGLNTGFWDNLFNNKMDSIGLMFTDGVSKAMGIVVSVVPVVIGLWVKNKWFPGS